MTEDKVYTDANPRPKWDSHNPHSRVGQLWVTTVRKIYNPLGFKKGYNFPLFCIGVGGLFGFCLARLYYFDFDGVFQRDAIPGEFYYYRGGHYKVGIIMHLVGVLVSGLLVWIQFVPIIRYKVLLLHRINGYLCILLLTLGIVGAFMIARHTVGGDIALQVWVGAIGVLILIGLSLAYLNIKRLQIDQHRAWMLRSWVWAASIISLRLILLAAVHVMQTYDMTYHTAISCSEIFYMYQAVGVPDVGNPTSQLYPLCLQATDRSGIPTGPADPITNSGTYVSVSSVGTGPENAAATQRLVFPMAAWLALVCHVLVVEIYLWLTPAESYRLRTVSYERQVEKGLRPKGRFRDAGLTGTSIGDAPEWWSMPMEEYIEQLRLRGDLDEKVGSNGRGRSESGTEVDGSSR